MHRVLSSCRTEPERSHIAIEHCAQLVDVRQEVRLQLAAHVVGNRLALLACPAHVAALDPLGEAGRALKTDDAWQQPLGRKAPRRGVDDRPDKAAPDRVARDRKSTRLNSSHLVISYAVFCL